jgi:hypothetical protein
MTAETPTLRNILPMMRIFSSTVLRLALANDGGCEDEGEDIMEKLTRQEVAKDHIYRLRGRGSMEA